MIGQSEETVTNIKNHLYLVRNNYFGKGMNTLFYPNTTSNYWYTTTPDEEKSNY